MAPADPELREFIKEMNRSKVAARFRKDENDLFQPDGEVFPTAVMPALASSRSGQLRVFPMKWGFRERKLLLINARAETAADKTIFRDSWSCHRCAIPASWYYEWEHDAKSKTGQKYALRPATGGLVWFAALYRMENDIPVFVILTRPADDNIHWIHNRMPVMLPKEEIRKWIFEGFTPGEILGKSLKEISWQQAV